LKLLFIAFLLGASVSVALGWRSSRHFACCAFGQGT